MDAKSMDSYSLLYLRVQKEKGWGEEKDWDWEASVLGGMVK